MITFFEKTGCLTNRKQKALLSSAGIEFQIESLLDYPWSEAELASFFDGVDISGWFNPAAPAVKSGELNPAALDRASALALLVADPILIKRPLLAEGERRMAGFDLEKIHQLFGFDLAAIDDPLVDMSKIDQCSKTGSTAKSAGGSCP